MSIEEARAEKGDHYSGELFRLCYCSAQQTILKASAMLFDTLIGRDLYRYIENDHEYWCCRKRFQAHEHVDPGTTARGAVLQSREVATVKHGAWIRLLLDSVHS